MTNPPPRTRAFYTRPATGSFLDIPTRVSPASNTYVDRHMDRVVTLLSKRMLSDRARPRG